MAQASKEAVRQRKEARRDLLEGELRRMVGEIARCPGVLRVILFGSLARGESGAHSDLDLAVIQETGESFAQRADALYRQLAPRVATDILVYTPGEWHDLAANRSFARRIEREGRVLYDAQTV